MEPEILIDGDHSIQTSADVSQRVISACVAALWQQPGISLEATLLKPQMCIPGADWPGPAPAPAEVAEHTLRVLKRCTLSQSRNPKGRARHGAVHASDEHQIHKCASCRGAGAAKVQFSIRRQLKYVFCDLKPSSTARMDFHRELILWRAFESQGCQRRLSAAHGAHGWQLMTDPCCGAGWCRRPSQASCESPHPAPAPASAPTPPQPTDKGRQTSPDCQA